MSGTLRRRIRHTRRLLGYGLLLALIVLALAVSLLIQALPLVAQHPDKVAHWLGERFGQPVSFSQSSAEWTRRGPRWRFEGLRIGSGLTALDIGRADLQVAVYSGLLPGKPLTELRVRDLALRLEQGRDGRWQLAGLPFKPQPGVDPLDLLEPLGELHIERAQLVVASPALHEELLVPRIDLRLRVSGSRLRAGLRAWATQAGTPMSAAADLDRKRWSGDLWAGGRKLKLSEWSRLLADTGLVIAGSGDVDLWARLEDQQVRNLRSRVDLAPLALGSRRPWLASAEGRLSSPPVVFERARMLARWEVDANGWQLHAPRLQFHESGRKEPHRFDGLWLAGGKRFALTAPRMDLGAAAALATLSASVPPGLRRWLLEAAPNGELHDVQLQGEAGRWRAAAALESAGWAAHAGRPGLTGLSGKASFDQDGGVFRLGPAPLRFDWAKFRQPLEFELAGTLGWWRNHASWTIGASGLRVRGEDFGALARMELQFQGDGTRPRMDLAAQVDTTPVVAARKFWVVGKMPAATIDWLDRALTQGSIEQGRAVLAGDLDLWPFRNGQGRFDAQARLQQGRVAFSPQWPEAEALDLAVAFNGPGMTLEGSGKILDNPVARVGGGIADFREPRLLLDIDTPANGEKLQALMLASPLEQRFGSHLRSASVRGPASVALALDLPLSARLGNRRIQGSLDLLGARLADPRWDLDFTQVRGRTEFSDGGFAATDLQVRFEGSPAQFTLQVGEGYTGDPGLAAKANLLGEFPANILLRRHPPLAWLEPLLEGSATWDIGVDIPRASANAPAAPARLTVTSDLVGVHVDLPAPLGKSPSEPWPLRLAAPLPVQDGEVSLSLDRLMQMRARTGANADDGMTGILHFGPGAPGPLPARGLAVSGATPTLDAAGWIAFAAKGEGAGALQAVDLRVASLDLLGSPFADTLLRLRRAPDSTQVELDGAGVAGQIVIATPLAGGVRGSFERLHWPERAPPSPEEQAQADAGQGQDPTVLPPLSFSVKDLRVGTLELGQTELQARPVAKGLRVERFTSQSAGLQLDASGDWLRSGDGVSQSRFTVDISARSLGELLAAFGLADMVSQGKFQGRLEGQWPGSPGAFALARFQGRLKAEVGEGQLLEVEPGGGGRVLGLISLAEIPRRLTLDFSDFFEKGFGFNTMTGEFVFAQGRASTELLRIDGPAAEIRVSGSTDLRTQQYDQRIEVLPKAGGVLPAIGAIAGGPVGAAVGAVAQAVLQQPLKQAGRTVYRVTGPWANPDVEVLERGPPKAAPADRKPAGTP
jgi:uncharacterized protein (TIGR02099 family)